MENDPQEQPPKEEKEQIDPKKAKLTIPPGQMDLIAKDVKEDIKETFDFFDKDETGMIFTPDLKPAMRMLGMNPKLKEIEDLNKIVS